MKMASLNNEILELYGLFPSFKNNYLFVYLFLVASLLRVAFLKLRQAGAPLHCGVRSFHCSGFSCCGARPLGMWASIAVARGLSSCGLRALERRLRSCGAWA